MEYINYVEQIQHEKDAGEPKCDHCDCAVELSNSCRTVLAKLNEYKTNQHKNLFKKIIKTALVQMSFEYVFYIKWFISNE